MLLLGMASLNPETRRSTTEAAKAADLDVSGFKGWPYYHVANDDEHPSSMGAQALKMALADAQLEADSLDFILFTGMSRDYLPSWSVATEIAKLVDAQCVAWDLTAGCLGMMMGLETASGWLASNPKRRYGAVVCAERWAFTVNRCDVSTEVLWAHSDGAAAVIVGAEAIEKPAIAAWEGVSFVSLPTMNGYVRMKYGGTRHPIPENGDAPFERQLREDGKKHIATRYFSSFGKVIAKRKAEDKEPARLAVCNQISPNFVGQVEDMLEFARGSIPRTAEEHGHVGSCDTVLGLQALIQDTGTLQEPTMLLSSSPYIFVAGSLSPV
jgi:3-oxoacyl-[acyl-carrier-protein] synthase III